MKPTSVNIDTRQATPLRYKFSVFATDTLDFIEVPGFPSAIRLFALTHSRRNVVQRLDFIQVPGFPSAIRVFALTHSRRNVVQRLDFIQVPGFPSAIRLFALTHSRRNVVQRYPWLISFSLDL